MRVKDLAYEALAAATSTDMSVGRGELNKALQLIREQADLDDDLESSLLAGEIQYRATLYKRLFPGAAITPTALAKHWLRVLEAKNGETGTNRHVPPTDCDRCGGDRLVLASAEGEHEVYARCPDCVGVT